MGTRAFFHPPRNPHCPSAVDTIPDDIFPPPLASGSTDPGLSPPGSFISGHCCQQPRQIFFSARFKRASASFGSGRGGLTAEPVDAGSVPALSGGGRSFCRGWRWPTGALGVVPNAGEFDGFEGVVPWAWGGWAMASAAVQAEALMSRMMILPHHL